MAITADIMTVVLTAHTTDHHTARDILKVATEDTTAATTAVIMTITEEEVRGVIIQAGILTVRQDAQEVLMSGYRHKKI